MTCIINSIIVIFVAWAISWLAAALVFVKYDFNLPFLPSFILYLLVYRGFRQSPKIQQHCGWTVLLGCVLGAMLPFPNVQGRFSIEHQLLGFVGPFGLTNAALIGSTFMVMIFAIWECLTKDADHCP